MFYVRLRVTGCTVYIQGPLALPTVSTNIMHSTTQHFGVRCLFSEYWFLLNILIHKHRCSRILSIWKSRKCLQTEFAKNCKNNMWHPNFQFLSTPRQSEHSVAVFYCFTTLAAWLHHQCKLQIHAWIINKGFMVMSSTPTSFLALVARPECQVS